MPTIIQPTIGRIVHYHPAYRTTSQPPLAAIVCGVQNERSVNLAVFERDGSILLVGRENVRLVQDGEPTPPIGEEYAEWMPWQVQQAAMQGGQIHALPGSMGETGETLRAMQHKNITPL